MIQPVTQIKISMEVSESTYDFYRILLVVFILYKINLQSCINTTVDLFICKFCGFSTKC